MKDDYTPDTVCVVDDDGVEHIFEELDRIETDDGKYIALMPTYASEEEMEEDDGSFIILKVDEESGENILTQIEDEEEFEEVGKIFEGRLAELFEYGEEDEEE
ncbi:MAG: DUF1292 domain-containing protein [Oscillospiraceae bacterium]|nr:DUF1292 domain-containing protein [Oscillospiraceae bacterium]